MNVIRVLVRLFLGRRLPITDGTLLIPGINEPVLIHRDEWGVPHIVAQTDHDAWYGLGFCQGQDRTFQLESALRVVRGTLSEVVGKEALPIDRLSRRIGFIRSAKTQLELLDTETRGILESFAEGVTDGARVGLKKRPHEFVLLGNHPTPWTATDILGFAKLQSFVSPTNWDVELARLKMLCEDGPDAVAALDPTYPEWHPVISQAVNAAEKAMERLAEDLVELSDVVGRGGSSNNWVLAAERTETGRPLLANNPHLGPTVPNQWYFAHVRTPEWGVAGGCFVGSPAFAAGHNGHAAWGVTFGLVDNTDLFLEEMGKDGRSVRLGDTFVPCQTQVEKINVKGSAPVTEEVLISPRGPIIGSALDGEVGAVSVKAVWLDPLPVRGLFRLNRVRSFDDFRDVLQEWPFISLNMIYADPSGTIGWQLAGGAPQRRKGWGTMPLPAWDPAVGWDGYVPPEEMPHLQSPASAFVATANNQPVPGDDSPYLGMDWCDGYRQARIVELLESRSGWNLSDIQHMQTDVEAMAWRDIRDIVLHVSGTDKMTERALKILRDWDGRITPDSIAATVYELFVSEMVHRLVNVKAPRSSKWALGRGFTSLAPLTLFAIRRTGHLVRLLRDQPTGWFEDPWDQVIADALSAVVRRLEDTYGRDSAKWSWGKVRSLTFRHPFGTRKPLDRLFNIGPIPWGGDADTIGAAGVPAIDPTANPFAVDSMRMVVDVGQWDEARFVLPGGQSGNPLSPHYTDQLALWQRGVGIPIFWSDEAVAKATRHTLGLSPA